MTPKQLEREMREIDTKSSIESEVSSEGDDVRSTKGPLYFLAGLFMALILILVVVPIHIVKIDPQPGKILSLEDVNKNIIVSNYNSSIRNIYSYRLFYEPSERQIKQISDRIVSTACDGQIVCHSKAIFYFVRDKLDYIKDPETFEYIKKPLDTIYSGGGDCDDKTILLANMLGAVGVQTRLVFIPNHVYLEAYLPDAKSKYTDDVGWVALDSTCSYCEFGEIPRANLDAKKVYLEI